MAGSNAGFQASQFRDAIRFVAKMATPNATAMIPRFHWDDIRTVPNPALDGRPYRFDGSATPTAVDHVADFTLDTVVAIVDHSIEGIEGTRAGPFRGQKMTLTILDTEMDKILAHGGGRQPDSVFSGDTEYRIEEIPKPDTIFPVDVWTVHAYADKVAPPT